jgi:hypothetical protein
MTNRTTLFTVTTALLMLVAWRLPATAQEYEEELTEPAVRATQRAVEREERRRALRDPAAREAMKAARREETREYAQAVEIRDPVPLPVEVRNPAASFLAGKPAGDSCPGNDECQLQTQVSVREVLIVTAVWSATKAECDHISLATPNTAVPIAPWWACRRSFRVEGPGAGYSGFTVTQ